MRTVTAVTQPPTCPCRARKRVRLGTARRPASPSKAVLVEERAPFSANPGYSGNAMVSLVAAEGIAMGELERLFMATRSIPNCLDTGQLVPQKHLCCVSRAVTPAYVGPTTALLSGLPCLFPTFGVADRYFRLASVLQRCLNGKSAVRRAPTASSAVFAQRMTGRRRGSLLREANDVMSLAISLEPLPRPLSIGV